MDSELQGDRKGYQLDIANGRQALVEALLDEDEGADILMVKPGTPYLDVLANLRQRTDLPLASYQVGGEYAGIKYAAMAGALDEQQVVFETLGRLQARRRRPDRQLLHQAGGGVAGGEIRPDPRRALP